MLNLQGFVEPFTDFGFKKIFGEPESKEVLIGFLNAVLNLQYPVADIEYLNTEKLGRSASERKIIFDVRCQDTNNQEFLVELQNAKQSWIVDRMVYYASQAIYEQGKIGKDWKYKLNPVYSIAIQNFTKFSASKEYVHHAYLKNGQNEIIFNKLQFVFIEVPKFKKSLEQCKSEIDYWSFLFKNMGELDTMPKTLDKINPIKKAFELARIANLNEQERRRYEADLKAYRDNLATLDYAKEEGFEEGRLEGRLQGRLEGRLEGIEEGIEKGIVKGKAEGQLFAKLETAKNLLAMKLSIEQVIQATGLSKDDLKSNDLI